MLDALCTRLRELCPGLKIAGAEPSRFRLLTAQEQEETAERIRDSGAQILFAGLGCPRQEVFAYEMGEWLEMPILAVGAAFDYYAGLLKEPPEFLQRVGLQWLYRLVQEPGRLWRRYLFTNSQYVGLFFAQWLGLWKPKLEDVSKPGENVHFG